MLDRLKQLFQPKAADRPSGAHGFDELQLAAAALMVEAAAMDSDFDAGGAGPGRRSWSRTASR